MAAADREAPHPDGPARMDVTWDAIPAEVRASDAQGLRFRCFDPVDGAPHSRLGLDQIGPAHSVGARHSIGARRSVVELPLSAGRWSAVAFR